MDRSEIMRRVKSRDTTPEKRVRTALRVIGWTGYRLQRRELPGKPDIAFIGRKRAIFVHGCFWHGHECKRGNRRPKANAEYWRAKISKNKSRDFRNLTALNAEGWTVLVIWECETRDPAALQERLRNWMQTKDSG